MKEMNNCCCCCSETKEQKVIKIDYLYLDLKTCDRCVGTDVVLEEVIKQGKRLVIISDDLEFVAKRKTELAEVEKQIQELEIEQNDLLMQSGLSAELLDKNISDLFNFALMF